MKTIIGKSLTEINDYIDAKRIKDVEKLNKIITRYSPELQYRQMNLIKKKDYVIVPGAENGIYYNRIINKLIDNRL